MKSSGRRNFLYLLLKFFVSLFFFLFFRLEVKNKEVFPKDTPFILASNHLSNLDPPLLGVACPYELAFLAKEELFKCKPFAWLIRRLNAVALSRENLDIKALRLALKILKDKPLLIFPEGRRSPAYSDFKAGVGFLYRRTALPIVVAKIYGTDKALCRGAKFIKPAKLKVVFSRLEGINPQMDSEEISRKVEEKIRSL